MSHWDKADCEAEDKVEVMDAASGGARRRDCSSNFVTKVRTKRAKSSICSCRSGPFVVGGGAGCATGRRRRAAARASRISALIVYAGPAQSVKSLWSIRV